MSWIAISDGRRVLRTPDVGDVDRLLSVGTIISEVAFSAEDQTRQTVVRWSRDDKWQRDFHISLGPLGDILVEHRQAGAKSYAFMKFPKPDPGAELRITLSWHAPERLGLLTVENLATEDFTQKVYEKPHPWLKGDVAALIGNGTARQFDPSVTLFAVSDAIEPVGLARGFAAGTLVDTPNRQKPVEDLQAGDIVQTSEHGMQPIRRIASFEVPSAGRFAPIELTAPFFGLENDLSVAPNHRLLVSGADAEYLFGTDEVLVEAHYLARMAAPLEPSRPATIRYVHVLMDAHVCLSVGGAWGESLYLGNLADDPKRLRTSPLANVPPNELPRHTRIAGPQLKGYEAIVLVSALCA